MRVLMNYFTIFLTFLLYCRFSASAVTPIHQQLRKHGYVEIENRDFVREDYAKLYKKFDAFIGIITNDCKLQTLMPNAEKKFKSIGYYNSKYCGTPPSFRDPSTRKKKTNRIYLQFILENYRLMNEFYRETIQIYPELIMLHEDLEKVDAMAKKVFTKVLDDMEEKLPGIKKTMYGKHQELTVVTKIMRYKRDDNWHTTPHFDKCGLTLIWDSDDGYQSFKVCEDTIHPRIANLVLPTRQYAHLSNATSALLIIGTCMKPQGIDLYPTLHYVDNTTKIRNEYRHSIVSFVLVPDIDTSDMEATFQER